MSTGMVDRPSLVAVVGAKGGCGTTLVATHLAVMEALAPDKPEVCLADLDFSRGDVARALNIEDFDVLRKLVEYQVEPDKALLRTLLPRHSSGVVALTQPYDLASTLQLESPDFARLLSALQQHHEFLVVDCGVQLDANTIATLSAAQTIVLVTRASVPALRGAQRMLTLFEHLRLELGRVVMVVNAHEASNLSRRDVEQFLNHPVASMLPADDASCLQMDNTGELLTEFAPNAALTLALQQLAASLTGRRPVTDSTPLAALRRFFPTWRS